jgi:hypothetical protein
MTPPATISGTARTRRWNASRTSRTRLSTNGPRAHSKRKRYPRWPARSKCARIHRAHAAGSAVVNIALYALPAVGLARTRRREPRVVGGIIGFFVVMWLVHVPYQVVMRFRIPFTDPLMIVFAASAIVHAFERRMVTSAQPR